MRLPPREWVEPDAFVQKAYENDMRIESSCFSSDKWCHQQRFKKVVNALKPGNLLDMGCAEGAFSLPLAQKGWTVFCIDKYIGFLRYMRLKIQLNQITPIHVVCGNGINLPFKDQTYDNVLLGEILEHQAYPELLLNEARRVLRRDGRLIITTPLRPYYTNRSYFLRKKYDNAEIHQSDGHPTHHTFEFTPFELDALLKKNGLHPLHIEVFGARIWEAQPVRPIIEHLSCPLRMLTICEKIILWLNNMVSSERLPWQLRASTILAVAK